jgi:hypothetical protein
MPRNDGMPELSVRKFPTFAKDRKDREASSIFYELAWRRVERYYYE